MNFYLKEGDFESQACHLAWAGGFLDGEGCIHIAKTSRSERRDTYRLRLTVSQNCVETLWHLQSVLGIRGGLHRIVRRVEHNRQCYVLAYDGRQARDAIQSVLPHLVRKRIEAQTALAFYKEGRVEWHPGRSGCPEELWRTREKFYRKLRALK